MITILTGLCVVNLAFLLVLLFWVVGLSGTVQLQVSMLTADLEDLEEAVESLTELLDD
jgi:hypothetical protein